MLKIFFDIVIGNDDILVNDENFFEGNFNILDVCDNIIFGNVLEELFLLVFFNFKFFNLSCMCFFFDIKLKCKEFFNYMV